MEPLTLKCAMEPQVNLQPPLGKHGSGAHSIFRNIVHVSNDVFFFIGVKQCALGYVDSNLMCVSG